MGHSHETAGDAGLVRIAIAASHAAVNDALHALIATDPRVLLVEIVRDGRSAARCLLQHHPDVLALALPAATADGGTLIRTLRMLAPDTAVVVISTAASDAYKSVALAAGAVSLVALDGSPDLLLDALHAASRRR